MNIIIKARRAVVKFGGVSGASVALGIPRSTLRDWLSKAPVKVSKTPPTMPPKVETPKGQWMQNFHHGQAHFLINGEAACCANANGAKTMPADRWFAWDGCLAQCKRCMPHAT